MTYWDVYLFVCSSWYSKQVNRNKAEELLREEVSVCRVLSSFSLSMFLSFFVLFTSSCSAKLSKTKPDQRQCQAIIERPQFLCCALRYWHWSTVFLADSAC